MHGRAECVKYIPSGSVLSRWEAEVAIQMKLRIFQKGFNYSQDGVGNRLVWHLQGCNMQCPWCSNPEGMSVNGELITEEEWLKESCCPHGAVKDRRLDREVCCQCKDKPCIQNRRQKGIRLSYKEYTVDEVVRECVSAKPMFFDKGGVTLTGGEISVQFEAAKELLQELGKEGIHRAIECNGSHAKMEELIPYVEQWIMDVKHYDEEQHKAWVGMSNKWTLMNLEKITTAHPNVLIRVPLIPGFNDNKEDAKGFAELFKEKLHGTNTRVEFLVYHEFGKRKWEQCGKAYQMKNERIAPELREYFEEVMKDNGIKCVRT